MRISTRLRLAVFVPALMALVVIAALVFSYQDMEKTRNSGDTVRQIRSGITELNHFIFSYVLYHEERPRQQFLAGHDALTRLIAGAQVRNQDQQRLLDRIREDSETMKDLFLQLVSNYENTSVAGTDERRGPEERLTGLLLLRSYEADSDASTLRSLVDDGIRTTEIGTTGLIFLVIVLATVPLTIVLVRTRRSITSSLSNLSKGAAVIGSGNLDFRIDETKKDEIGDLSRAFNRMTADLKTVTASKDDLEREIDERKKAEYEVKRLNEDLRRRAAELEVANKELESFSYSVSHDLRSPLRSMEGFSQALLEDYTDKLDAQGKGYLTRVQKSSQFMAELIDNILELSRVTRSDMQWQPVNLSEIAESITADLRNAQPQRTVECAIAPGLTALGDQKLLRVMLRNLLDNAWKFTAKVPNAQVEFGTMEYNGEKTYFVRDNGAGFDMAYAGKLFTAFQRLHSHDEFPGSGIGLATAQRIVRRHGGRVWAEGEPGKGATLYFTLGQ